MRGSSRLVWNFQTSESGLGMNCSYFVLFVFADVQREEKNVEKTIREAAKRNDMGSAKVRLV